MPTYDYKCKECENEFEEFQQMTDKPVKKCPKCGGKVQRLIGTGAGIVFKGSGFYEKQITKKLRFLRSHQKHLQRIKQKNPRLKNVMQIVILARLKKSNSEQRERGELL